MFESRMHWFGANQAHPDPVRVSYPLYYSRIVMTFTDSSWLQYQYNYTVSYIFPDDYLIQNRVRNDVSKRYDDSISLKIRACGGLKNPGKSWKYI